MASRLYYVNFILALISLLLVEIVQGREISTIKKENNDTIKNVTARNGLILPALRPNAHQLQTDNVILHHAAITWPSKPEYWFNYEGAKATLNVYSLPEVGDDQTSTTAIWAVNGTEEVMAGWHVHPKLYGDHDTHFFVAWRVNDRGCFNLNCKGFVKFKSPKYVPGIKLDPVSKVDGQQYELTVQISIQPGGWWVVAGTTGGESDAVGHFPQSLFTSLAYGASMYQWGGAVSFYPDQKSPPMGSGRYPREGFGKAAFLKDVQLIFSTRKFNNFSVKRVEDQTYCYQVDGDNPMVYFGGPGGCTS